jgi:mRNA interferase RelE/StbE
MKTAFRKSFTTDLKRYENDKRLLARIRGAILEVEEAGSINSITNLKRLKAEGSYYRIRVGNYRIGLIIESETATFVRVLHRSEIYRYFP